MRSVIMASWLSLFSASGMPGPAEARSIKPVSMLELLMEGRKYLDLDVVVIGYLNSDTALRLYLTEDHARAWDARSSVLVGEYEGITESKCISHYVSLTGVVKQTSSGQSLILGDIAEIRLAEGLEVCWQPPDAEGTP